MYNPLLEAIKRLGGSASISELNEEVTKYLQFTDEEIAERHRDAQYTKLEYQLAWVRTYLKAYELLNNSENAESRSVTPKGNRDRCS